MKASQLIENLKRIIEQHGDHLVYFSAAGLEREAPVDDIEFEDDARYWRDGPAIVLSE